MVIRGRRTRAGAPRRGSARRTGRTATRRGGRRTRRPSPCEPNPCEPELAAHRRPSPASLAPASLALQGRRGRVGWNGPEYLPKLYRTSRQNGTSFPDLKKVGTFLNFPGLRGYRNFVPDLMSGRQTKAQTRRPWETRAHQVRLRTDGKIDEMSFNISIRHFKTQLKFFKSLIGILTGSRGSVLKLTMCF